MDNLVEKEVLDRQTRRVRELEKKLAEAESKHAKAISYAQIRKAGFIYVVSNVGSLGEDIYRIGMTRTIPPDEPISKWAPTVPFPFDIHATIFSENAREMEDLLHRKFENRRVNRVNNSREFFRASLDEIKQAVEDIASETGTVKQEIRFTMIAPAEEYRKTQAFNRGKNNLT